ncbi:MAG: radical SAM protein [Candidatus Cloacimonetes bacterium HGW-Cloacimonetes-1]|jgi:wyosine [tRNA(Phe)-imidazoG37] synthetase (radical SAM superfamily)|nr:MAG: radical SAM protein [Candidatus Cloacimonetes bacterium HGW-Cloacimonetes-1]
MNYKHLFGPVNSRRLGTSLGVDLIPFKYCPLNCVYCEVQSTTHLTLERSEYFPITEILTELDAFLSTNPHLDYITFSGAGEPTLYSKIGDIIAFIKTNYPQYKVALLTNSILLHDEELRREILVCDLILPSLDAVSQEAFEKINRPVPGVLSTDIIAGLIALRQEYHGKMLLEVFIVPGINAHDAELILLAEAINAIKPDEVQINSLDRPGTEDWVTAADPDTLKHVKKVFEKLTNSKIEIIAKLKADPKIEVLDKDIVNNIKSILIRRPLTAEDLASTLNLHINEVSKILRQLSSEAKLSISRENRGVFYQWIQ